MGLVDYAAGSRALVSVRRDATGEIDVALDAHGLSRMIALTLPHMLVLPSILASGDMVAAIPRRAAAEIGGERPETFEIPLALAPCRDAPGYTIATRPGERLAAVPDQVHDQQRRRGKEIMAIDRTEQMFPVLGDRDAARIARFGRRAHYAPGDTCS